MFAATETTVYYAVPSATVGSYTVKLNTNQQTNPDAWYTYTMTKTDKTYQSNPIYSCTFTDLWDGVDCMQIQLYDGDTWKSQEVPVAQGSWASAATYNGKMWVHGGSSWIAYAEDAESGSGSSENVVTYDFTSGIEGLSSWGNSYSAHSQTFKDGAIVEFEAASKQTSTITDMPVTKGKYVIFKAPANKSIKALTFTCQQWTTKTQTITLHTSTDGGENFSATTTTSSNFILSASNLTNVNAVKFTFSSSSNQIGIKSLAIVYAAEEGGDTPDPTPAEKDTVYYVNVNDWPAVNAHMWEGSAAGTTWPGLAMTKTAEKFNNHDIYMIAFEEGAYTKIIFSNNGDSQTADLTIDLAKPYYNGTTWVASLEEEPEQSVTHYLVGDSAVMKAWDASQALAMVNDTIEFKNLAAGTYKFKILDRQTWTDAVELTCNDLADGVDAGCDGSNVQFTLSKAADIVIKVVNNKIVILGIPEAAKKEIKLLNAKELAAAEATMFVHFWGEGITATTAKMTLLKEGKDTLGFSAEILEGATGCCFVRMPKDAATIDWDTNWGETGDAVVCDSMYFQGWTGAGIFAVSCEAPLTETVFTVVVPASIDSMFIAGSFNEWSFAKMSLVEGEDSIYTLTVPGDQRGAEYKYAAGPDWSYVEVRTCDEGDCNRSYAVKDTVKAFTSVPVVVEYTTIKLLNAKALAVDNAKMFVHAWGTGIADQDVEMSILKEGNDTLGFEAEINKLAEQLAFVRMNGEAEGINWEENWGKSADLDRCANDSMYFQGWAEGLIAVSCEAPLTETVFTVVVPASTDSVFVAGSFNEWSFAKMSLVEGEDSIYTLTVPGDQRGAEYKYAAGPDWSYVEVRTCDEGDCNRSYAVKDTVKAFTSVPVVVEYTTIKLLNAKALAVDNAKMFVHAWGTGIADQDVEMSILKEGNDTLGFEAEINKLAEQLAFVRMNGEAEGINWEENWGKSADLDRCANDSMYFQGWAEGLIAVSCEAVVEDKQLYVIGSAAVLGGWNIDNAVEMTDGELTVTLEGGQSYSFKIVATKAWDQPGQLQWGDQADGQAKLHADGTNIAFDMPSTAEVTIKVVDGKVVVEGIPDGEIVIPDTRYIIGSDAQMGNWQIENAVLMENNQITLTLPAGTYTFKIVATKAWNQAGQLDCNNIAEDAEHLDCDGTTDNNVSFVLSEEATVTIKLVDDKIYIEGVPEIPVEKVTYYFINNMEWETVYAYAYANEGAEKNADWPGELMTLTNAACTNGAVYSIEIAEGFETIIFNNGNGGDGNQTANLAIEAGKPYYYNEVAYAALDDACESVEPQPVVAYYLAGEMTSWVVADMPAFVDNQVKVTLTEVKEYNFKVVQTVDEAQTWLTNENAGTMTRENCTGWSFIALDGEDNNTKLNADVAGEYTFTLDLTDGVKVSVTFPNKEQGSGLEQILMNNGLEKFIYNGHFYIRRENKLYNVQGQLVR